MHRLLFTATLLGSLTALGSANATHAGHRDCGYGYPIGPLAVPRNSDQSNFHLYRRYQYGYRPLTTTNPQRRYRYGDPPAAFGNFYRDRQGFFFYGLDDRYRFGIHR